MSFNEIIHYIFIHDSLFSLILDSKSWRFRPLIDMGAISMVYLILAVLWSHVNFMTNRFYLLLVHWGICVAKAICNIWDKNKELIIIMLPIKVKCWQLHILTMTIVDNKLGGNE